MRTRERGRLLLLSEFIEVLVARFWEQLLKDLIAELKKLKYVSSLQSYLEEFDVILSRTNLNEAQTISLFLGWAKRGS